MIKRLSFYSAQHKQALDYYFLNTPLKHCLVLAGNPEATTRRFGAFYILPQRGSRLNAENGVSGLLAQRLKPQCQLCPDMRLKQARHPAVFGVRVI